MLKRRGAVVVLVAVAAASGLAALLVAPPVLALDGQPGMHDPSTVVVHDGKY
jgi:hypothetical protein